MNTSAAWKAFYLSQNGWFPVSGGWAKSPSKDTNEIAFDTDTAIEITQWINQGNPGEASRVIMSYVLGWYTTWGNTYAS